MSDSVRPHRWQPTRLHRPWDSPGKNTGVGCHFLLQCMKVKSESEVAQSYLTPSDPMDCSLPGFSVHGIFQARVLEWVAIAFSMTPYSPWNSPGQNTGVGSLFLLQGIFPTQGSNPGLPQCRQILYQLSHKGSPRVLEWIAYPSPVDISHPRIEPGSPALQTDSLPTELSGKPLEGLKRMKKLSKGKFTPSAQLLPHEQGYFSSVI